MGRHTQSRFLPPLVWRSLPSLVEVSSPLRLGFVQSSRALLPRLRGDMAVTAPPVSNPTLSLPPSPVPPPLSARAIPPLAPRAHHHHLRAATPTRTHHFHPKQTTPEPTFPTPPPSHRPLPNHSEGARTPTRDPFILPQHRCFFLTAPSSDQYPLEPSPTTISTSAPVEQRPPPEPPPQIKLQTPKETLGSQSSSSQKQLDFAPPPSDLGPERPPRKPPDTGINSYPGSLVVAGASVGFFLCRMDFQICSGNIAPMVFDGKTQKRWACWKYMVCEGPYAADTIFCILSKIQSSSEQGFNRDNPETTCGRYVPAEAKKLIRNWIDKKTVDSHFFVVIDHVQKLID